MNKEIANHTPEEIAALYLAGALGAEEREALEGALATGAPTMSVAIKEIDAVSVWLADALSPIDPEPKTRVNLLQRIRAETQQTIALPSHSPPGVYIQHAHEAEWRATSTPGVDVRILYIDKKRDQATACLRMKAGHRYPFHVHHGVEELFVLDGDLHFGGRTLGPGDYHRAEAGSAHEEQWTEKGCAVFLTMPLAMLHL